jgi:hypothetical protein
MRVKVRFRFNAVTGEVEAFDVDDMRTGPRLPDHDARHDRAAADVARIVETAALIEEVALGAEPVTTRVTPAADRGDEPESPRTTARRPR